MLPTGLLLIATLLGAVPASAAPQLLLASTATWRHFKGTSEASTPTNALRDAAFDGAAWLTGHGPLHCGTNYLAIQAFNCGNPAQQDDFRIQAELTADYPDIFPPKIFTVDPPPGSTLSTLTQITVAFDEPMAGVVAGDFLVNGNPATTVSGSGNAYTFGFASPMAGPVQIQWDINHTLADTNGNRFDETAASARWEYTVVDATPPMLVEITPTPGTTVANLTQIRVTFSEPVQGVDAADLRINDEPAMSVVPSGAAYLFSFAATLQGPATVTWKGSHGIADVASSPNAFVPTSWNYSVDATAVGNVVINEFSAHWFRSAVLVDAEGDANDWIEIYNRGTTPVSLLGWSLSGDPAQPGLWEFPDMTLPPGQFLLVFASGKDFRPAAPGGELHTNFRLNQFGEYLGLFPPGLPRQAVSEFVPAYPEQRENISYGYTPDGQLAYFPTNAVTPGGANPASPSFKGVVSAPVASVNSGFFSQPFSVVLATETPDAIIRYTLDGSSPETGGILYTSAVPIAAHPDRAVVVLRATAHKADWLPSRTATHTYIFPFHVVTQPVRPEGMPAYWHSAERNDIPGDYEMDPQVLNTPEVIEEARQALTDLPSLSIVTDPGLLLATNTGCYVRKLKQGYQVPVHVDYLLPDGRDGFSVPAGIEVQGGTSPDDQGSSWKSKKLSLRLLFKGDFGNRKLNSRVFPDSPVEEFNTLMLDAGLNHWWHYNGSSNTEQQRQTATCIHDQWASDMQIAMGGLSFHGRAVHVYLNGLYWGMYILHERPDDHFAASYFGGDSDEYDVLKHTGTTLVAGNLTAYNQMLAVVRAGLADPRNYEALGQVLELPWFADYLLLNFYLGNHDWPLHNWYATRRRAAGGKWRFHSYDAEHVLENINQNVTGVNNAGTPGEIFQALRANAEFNLLVADRFHQHFLKPDGAFYVDPAHPVWQADAPERNRPADYFLRRINEIWTSLLCESARWGDSGNTTVDRATNPLRRDADLTPHLDNLIGWAFHNTQYHADVWNLSLNQGYFPTRGTVVLTQLRSLGLYPPINAPAFSRDGGRVTAGFSLFLTNVQGAGTVYYTTDGSDPRASGTGAVAPTAAACTANTPIVLNATTVVKARLRSGTTWSALNESTFTVGGPGLPLRITEIMYHPAPGGAPGSRYEFIELQNIGGTQLELSYYTFAGITFQFPAGFRLNPGARIVLGSNAATNDWQNRYPGVVAAGWFEGNLSNSGDRLALYDAAGRVVTSVDYSDDNGWPVEADGLGYSLELVDPAGDPDAPANWRASVNANGTPGLAARPPPAAVLLLNELMAANESAVPHGTNFPDWVELYNPGTATVSLADWSLTDDGTARKFVFPGGTSLPGGACLRLWCDETEPASTAAASELNTGFALNRDGECVFLYDAHTNRVDAVCFGRQIPDYSFGRLATDWGLNQPTPGAANQAAVVANASQLILNEWLADAPPGGADWIELHNRNASLPVALRGIYLGTSNGLHQVLAHGFIAAGGFVQLLADSRPGPDHLDFNLPKEGGLITLYDSAGVLLDQIHYDPQSENVTQGRLPNGSASIVAFPFSPSPAASNYTASYTGPRLNEVLARNQSANLGPAGQYSDWVELFNPSAFSVDLSGLRLSDAPDNPDEWVFPAGATIAGNGYLMVWCDGTQPASTSTGGPFNSGFSLNGDSGGVYLFNSLGQRVDWVEYGFQLLDQSIGRSADQWRLLTTPTPGRANAAAAALGAASDLRINEWIASASNAPDWFELYNRGALPVNLAGLFLTDNPSMFGLTQHRVPGLSFIAANGWVKYIADGRAGAGRDHVNFALDAQAETVRLYDAAGALMDAVDFGSQTREVAQGRLPDGADGFITFPGTASPGAANYLALTNVVINEVLAHTEAPFEAAIELHNPTAGSVNVGNWFLSNQEQDLQRYRFAPNTVIPAGGFLVVYEYEFNPNPGLPPSFALNASRGDTLYLSEADAAGQLSGRRTSVTFGPAETGVPHGRIPTSVGADFGALRNRTFGADNPTTVTEFRNGTGAVNALPLVGPVVLNELMYHPAGAGGSGVAEIEAAEFIELLNVSAQTVELYDPLHPTNGWRLSAAVAFDFPAGATLAATTACVVVNFDPAMQPATLAAFRAQYGLGLDLAVYGPWSGRLGNAGERVALAKPDVPLAGAGAGFVPYLLVDQVTYSDQSPWPTNGVDGGGASLQRIVATDYGNDPANWKGAAPTAGAINVAGMEAAPTIVTAPQSQTVLAGEVVTFTVEATGTPPPVYQWLFNGVEISGATAPSYILPSAHTADEGAYRVRVRNAAGEVISAIATLTVLVAPQVVDVQPASLTIAVGSNVTFAVSATGTAPLRYQWQRNGGELEGQTNVTWLLDNAQVDDTGEYRVVVSNAAGAVTSVVARLTVRIPPGITASPQNLTVTEGSDAVFHVAATGDAPLFFQWHVNGLPLGAANGPTLIVPAVSAAEDGNRYHVHVSNDVGVAVSGPATLSVLTRPVLRNVQRLAAGTFSFTLNGQAGRTYWLESSTNFTAWDPASDAPLTPGAIVNVNTTTNGTQRFYRARLEP